MENKLIAGIVASAIAIIVLAGVLMPALSNATTTEDTFQNEGMFFMKEYGSTDAYEASWDHTKPAEITINNEVVAIPATTNEFSLILDGNFFLRYFATTQALSLYYGSTAVVSAGGTDGYDMDVTFDGTDITFTNTKSTPDTRTITVDKFYSIANSGEYVMKKPNVDVYMNSDSIIYGCGRTTVSGELVGSLVYGQLDDPLVDIWRGNFTASDVTSNYTELDSHKDLYKFTSVTFTVTSTDDPTVIGNLTYSYVVVPYEVTAERSVHLSDAMNVILNVIPLLIIVAVLLGVVAIFIARRE